MSIVLDPKEWEPVGSSKVEVKRQKNQILTNDIVKHVFDNLGVSKKMHNTIHHEMFQSNKTLSYSDEDGQHKAIVYGSQAKVGDKALKIVHIKFSDDEAVLVVRLEDCPTYGCYLGDRCLIGVLAKDHWVEGSMFIQASFLAGMEQLREVGTVFVAIDVKEMFEQLKKFLMFEADCE